MPNALFLAQRGGRNSPQAALWMGAPWSEAIGVADLRTQSPPLAITLGEIIGGERSQGDCDLRPR
jgi:hypothetical protein